MLFIVLILGGPFLLAFLELFDTGPACGPSVFDMTTPEHLDDPFTGFNAR